MPHVKSTLHDLAIPTDVSLGDFVLRKARTFGNKVAFVDGQSGQEITYAQFVHLVRKIGSALFRRGVRKGDVICIDVPNNLMYPIILHSVVSIGAVLTTCNPLYTADELLTQLKDSNPKFIITIPMFLKQVKDAARRYGNIKIIVLGGESDGCEAFTELLKDDGSAFPRVQFNPQSDVAILPYSSGTTGLPKGVMLTHYNLVANLTQAGAELEEGPDEVYIGIVPFFHIYGITVIMNYSLICGATAVILPRFDLEEFLSACQKHKVTTLHIVPPIAILLAKHPMVDKYDLSGVHTVWSGAASLGKELTDQLTDKLPWVKIRQGYGMTETSPITHLSPLISKSGAAGKVISNTECKVVDVTTGISLGPYEEGEICTRGPQIMKGYHRNAEATRHTIREGGWLYTGDIGYYDEDGYFFVVDRLKELIKYKGFQVAPGELEALLLKHPAVADVGVIGLPDHEAGELPKAYVVRKEGTSVSERDLVEFVNVHVAPHKRLRGGVEFLTVIPKSASGKILRRILKQRVVEARASKL